MELEDINYLIGNANRNNATSLSLLFKGFTFLSHEISDFKNLTILNNSNYLGKMVK